MYWRYPRECHRIRVRHSYVNILYLNGHTHARARGHTHINTPTHGNTYGCTHTHTHTHTHTILVEVHPSVVRFQCKIHLPPVRETRSFARAQYSYNGFVVFYIRTVSLSSYLKVQIITIENIKQLQTILYHITEL